MRPTIKILLSFSVLLFFCEYVIYFLVLLNCKWPTLSKRNLDPYVPLHNDKLLRVMLIADTHLLGIYNGHWFDKLRREWQMKRSFQTALFIHNPDVVFILGDIFDEGKWARDIDFEQYAKNFKSIFAHDSSTIVKIVAGNHDMGFHYDIDKIKYSRFRKIFGSSTVDFWSINGINFVLLNSMAFEGDQCFLCAEAEKKINQLSSMLNCLKRENLERKGECNAILNQFRMSEGNFDPKNELYSKPIVLQHFPLYRKNDDNCEEDVDSFPKANTFSEFRQKWDCLSQDASAKILRKLEPRLIFSGHTHYSCRVNHKGDKNIVIPEFTVASFSWRNLNSPSFLLLKVSANDFDVSKCYLPQESLVIRLYIIFIPLIVIWFTRKWFLTLFTRFIWRNNQKTL